MENKLFGRQIASMVEEIKTNMLLAACECAPAAVKRVERQKQPPANMKKKCSDLKLQHTNSTLLLAIHS